MRGSLRSAAGIIVLLAVGAASAAAQTTYATITGTVTDSTGGVIKGATVVATNVETSVTTKTTTNGDGVYSVPQLREGLYTLTITAEGLGEFKATDILLVTRDIRRIDATMGVGGLETSLEVTGNAPIELETGRVSDLRTAEQLRTLPLNDPGVWSYLAITPSLGHARRRLLVRRQPGQSVHVRHRWHVDDRRRRGERHRAARELHRVVQGSKNRYGEQQRRVCRAWARSRSCRNRARIDSPASSSITTRARSSVRGIRSPARGRRESCTFPAWRSVARQCIPRLYDGHGRTFWFVSGETVNGSSASQDLNPTVPIEAWRRGDFSALGRQIRNPLTGEVYADGRIPAAALNAVALAIQQRFYPLPNTGSSTSLVAQNYRETVETKRSKPYYATARVDHNFGANDRIFGRFTFHEATNPVWEGNLPAFGMRNQRRMNKAFTFSYTRILGTSVVNELRAGHAYNNNPIAGPLSGSEIIQSLGIIGLAPGLPAVSGILKIAFPGTGLQGISQVDWRNPGFLNRSNQVQDQITWLLGTHSFKAGTDIRRVDWEELNANAKPLRQSELQRSGHRGSWSGGERTSVCRFPAGRTKHREPRVCTGAGLPKPMDVRFLRPG